MNVLEFVKNSGGRIFGDDFDITKVNTLNNALNNIPNKDNANNYDLMVLFNWVYSMAALIAVGFIVYGAIFYAISEGDPARVNKAIKTITYAVIGLVVIGLAWALTTFVVNSIS